MLLPIDRLRLPNETTPIPRLRDEPYLVSEYAAAFRYYGSWGEFPPVTVDQDMLILDGVTRYLGAVEADIDEAEVEVIECDSDAQRLLIAAEANAQHGKRWNNKDVTTIALLADRIGVEPAELARAMRVRVERVTRVPVTTVARRRDGKKVEERTYAKAAVRFALRDRVLTEAQEATMLSITTPNTADRILLDLLRIDTLDALPELNPDTYTNALAVQEVIARWITRDAHLLKAA